MQTPEEMALSFTGECEPASLGLCANHKSPLFRAAKTCLHVQSLTDLIRARDAEVAARALRDAAEDAKAIKVHAGGGNLVTEVRALTADALRARADRIEREGGAATSR